MTFTETSNQPYDRHKYKVHLSSGKVINCDWYDEARLVWFENPFAQHIQVVDRKKRK
jgi:hypothetical protein